MEDQNKRKDENGWERTKVLVTFLDAVARLFEVVWRR
jgi:hypothetical protein